MKAVVLASGSKGNVTYIEHKGVRLLIDIGKSCSYIEKKLREINVEPNTINHILITHTHSDHINGIKTFTQKYKPNIYITPIMENILNTYLNKPNYNYYNNITIIDNINIEVIKTSHDSPGSVGFIIDEELVYITDTGYINEKYFNTLSNKSIYILESNHDIELLYNGRYPYHLKRRIAGDEGHLSNIDASKYLSKFIGNKTKHIVLAHLSEENNTKEKALNTYLNTVNNKDINIIIALQDERTEVIEV